MSTAQQTRPQAQTVNIDQAAQLLDQVIANTRGGTYKVVERFFEDYIPELEELLPDKMKGQGRRLVKRALLTFEKSKSPKLKQCSPSSFIRCVLEAAELGLAIDGLLAHAVPYNNKKKQPDGSEKWVVEAQMQLDYKGLLAIAKRSGHIIDGRCDVVRRGDQFSHGRKNGQAYLEHTYDIDVERGEVIAAYGELNLPGGRYEYSLLQKSEVDKIRSKSKSKDDGPWVDWYDRMAAKSAFRRLLKTYCDDPQVQHAISMDEREYEGTPAFDAPTVGKVTRSALNDAMPLGNPGGSSKPSAPQAAPKTQQATPTRTETPAQSESASEGVDEPPFDEPNADDALAKAKQEIADAFGTCTSLESAAELADYWSDQQHDPQLRQFASLCFAQAKERFQAAAKPKPRTKKGQQSMIEDQTPDYYAQGQ
jgi:recombination protein RecT